MSDSQKEFKCYMIWQMMVALLHSNGQLRTEKGGGTERGCQKPAVLCSISFKEHETAIRMRELVGAYAAVVVYFREKMYGMFTLILQLLLEHIDVNGYSPYISSELFI